MIRNLYILCIALLLGETAQADSPKFEVSVVADWETVQHYGGVENTERVIKDTFNYAAYIFKRDVDLDLVIAFTDMPATAEEANQMAIPADTTVAGASYSMGLTYKMTLWRLGARRAHLAADATILMTTRDLMYNGSTANTGWANFCTVCAKNAVAVVELRDNGLDGYTLAHELGHILGAPHDGDVAGACSAEPKSGYIMEEILVGHDTFSPCSVREMKKWIINIGDCLHDTVRIVGPTTPTPAPTKKGAGAIDPLFCLILLALVALKRIWVYRINS